MTDRLLIYRFLKNFDIKIGADDFIVFDKFNHKEFKNSEFSKLFLSIFDDYTTDENLLPFEICQQWYDKKKTKYTRVLDKYLLDCVLSLGRTDWVVHKSDGTIVDEKKIKDLFSKKFDNKFLTNYYNRWYTENVINESEKIMGVF
jgi:hypothetical protein